MSGASGSTGGCKEYLVIVSSIAGVLALIVAVLAWLAPFGDVGPSHAAHGAIYWICSLARRRVCLAAAVRLGTSRANVGRCMGGRWCAPSNRSGGRDFSLWNDRIIR